MSCWPRKRRNATLFPPASPTTWLQGLCVCGRSSLEQRASLKLHILLFSEPSEYTQNRTQNGLYVQVTQRLLIGFLKPPSRGALPLHYFSRSSVECSEMLCHGTPNHVTAARTAAHDATDKASPGKAGGRGGSS